MSAPVKLICECCGRVAVDGFSKSEEVMLRNMVKAGEPLVRDEVMAGTAFDPASFLGLMKRFKTRLAGCGYTVVNVSANNHVPARYRLEPVKA